MDQFVEPAETVKLDELRTNDDGVETDTSQEQKRVEESIAKFYTMVEKKEPKLFRKEHVQFLLTGVKGLGSGYQSLDASRPWLCYWILHSLELLNSFVPVPENPIIDRVISFLSHCQSPSGGFGGGPNQLPHLAPTYAAVNSLMICGTEKAYTSINRETMYKFLLSLKDKNNGSFSMHKDGETDVRATYCALSVAKLLNLLTPELISGAAEFVGKCQTYEGGMGGFPGNEAHGGYTFCGFAALILLNRFDVVNLPLLIEWAVKRQMPFEGGFQGRTNKLVDSCYSFWQGGIFPLIDMAVTNSEAVKPPEELDLSEEDGSWLFVQNNLQKYLFTCCQEPTGGFRDKPGKSRDYYHTCYALSGLSVSQYNKDGTATIYGGEEDNLVAATHPVHNIGFDKVEKAYKYFSVK